MNRHYYPAFIDLKGRRCVVVGGGKTAERKISALLQAGATVTVISPVITGMIGKYCESKQIRHVKRNYRKGDLEGAFLVIAATSNEQVNREISLHAPCLLNVVDVPELANFIAPSVIRRGPFTLAVSTSGASPALAKSVRKELELFYSREFGLFADFLGKQRKAVLLEVTNRGTRERLLKQIAGPEMLDLFRREGFTVARNSVLKKTAAARKQATGTGNR